MLICHIKTAGKVSQCVDPALNGWCVPSFNRTVSNSRSTNNNLLPSHHVLVEYKSDSNSDSDTDLELNTTVTVFACHLVTLSLNHVKHSLTCSWGLDHSPPTGSYTPSKQVIINHISKDSKHSANRS